MKSLSLTTKKIVEACKLLDSAKYQKLDDADKIKLWKISRKLSPIANRFTEEAQDAQKKLMPFEDFMEKVQKAIQYERMLKEGNKENLPMSEEEYIETASEFKKYNTLVDSALKELSDKEETFEIEPLSEEAFGKLMASNDWTLSQVDSLEFLIKD